MQSETAHRMLRHALLATFVLGCFVCLFLSRYNPLSSRDVGAANLAEPAEAVKIFLSNKSNEKVITLLLWFWPFGVRTNLSGCSSRFNIEGCSLTADRNFYDEADGVIIHHRDISGDVSNLPKLRRPPFQKWIWMNMESPTNSPRTPRIENLFNLTLNYRQDSNIVLPYGLIEAADGKEDFVLPSKSKLVCWIVSNWNSDHVRVKYYNELHKHVQIHAYGRAFKAYVSKNDFLSTIASCKFYLSFENSIHKDYISEKFYNPLSMGTVPVVLGPPRQNYENFIQGDAFIHVDDFSSPKELADHLLLLNNSEEMYLRYFEWKRYFKVRMTIFTTEHACVTCDYLHKHKEYKALSNIGGWYWGD
ncbi:4-galactosyl-N-acetylglucosaminide 3-alpha-L-fucosyltransferase 9-like [Brachionichthys hirsutus]|uniref:4-galactosyl-N-acetylglucosaminide 3-alpha-L-fucosyltransferase 9-like n=1 Tax=Brachionichthys hirsutus TaxID=412623 RepID=UPI00360530C0